MNTIDDKISQLSPKKKAMFEKLLREKLLQQTQVTSEIKPIVREDNRYPLSYAQEKIWIANAFNPNTILYNMVGVTRAQGEAKMPLFIEGLKSTFNKHEILRMNFKKEGDTAYARVNEEAYFEPIIYDYSQKPHDREAVIEDVMNQVARKPFDLEKETLIRVALVCTAPDDWTIILVIHHIIGDGISINIILGEALEYRHNKLKNVEAEIKQFPIQFKDYAWWEKNKERDAEAENSSEIYWQTQLEGANFSLDLFKAKLDGVTFNNTANREDFSLDTKLVKDIQVIAQKEKVTAFSIYLAALKLLIYKYSMQDDLVLGVVTFGRDLAEVSQMIGCFVDILPIRSAIDTQMTFIDFTKQVYHNFLENYDKKDAYFKQEQQFTPQFLFNYKESSEVKAKIDGLELNSQEINSGYSRVPMEFDLIKSGEEVAGGITYREGVLNEVFIKDFIERYNLILNSLISEPTAYLSQTISEITITTQSEKTQILKIFNDTIVDYPKNKTVVELFEEQAKKTPDNVAIVYKGVHLTYRELNEKSNQLAHLLRSKGVGRESLVGVLSERSLEMIIAIHGIIKAGGAYVPIDPTYPAERVAYMAEDCDFELILTYQAEIQTEKETIDLGDSTLYEDTPKENLSRVNMPEDIIYVIYTSGTTGKPKGVMVEHRNVINLVKHTNYTKLDEETVILQTGSMSFDASTFELWGATLNGGKMVLIPHETLLNATLLKEEIIKNEINTAFFTVTLYNQLIDVDISMFDSFKYLLIGGEAVSEEHVRKLAGRNAELNFSNAYGPTESTTFSLYYPITTETLREKTPIGRPISNTQAYVLNDLNLCGVGMPGELCVAGDGVARGYLNQPEMTSAKFLDNPYGGGKLYRTGDLARWLEDGNIECLGRIDDQVKIRGFRIELGEIESVLRNQVGVADCAVIVREDSTGDKGLYGYVVSESELDISVLKADIAKELPSYMIPGYMIQIDKLPLSPTGKLDKRSLPAIEAATVAEYVAPTTEMEEKICAVFAEVLEVDRVGIHDGFFQLGGHSLKAVRLINRIKEVTGGMRLPVNYVFESPTPMQIAAIIDNRMTSFKMIDTTNNDDVELKFKNIEEMKIYLERQVNQFETDVIKGKVAKQYPISAVQEFSLEIGLTYSGAIIEFNHEINVKRLQESIKKLINLYGLLKSIFVKQNDKIMIQEFETVFDGDIPYINLSHQSRRIKEKFVKYIVQNYYGKNKNVDQNLCNRVLYNIMILKEADDKYRVFMPANHLVFDGMSSEIVKNKLKNIYYNDGDLENVSNDLSYEDYINQINKGPQNISDDELINDFDLLKFSDRLDVLLENDDQFEYRIIKISTDKDFKNLDSQKLFSIASQLFLKVMYHNFGSTEVPFFMFHTGRRYENQKYYHTIGEFIDILPFQLEDLKDGFTKINERNQLVEEKNINFTTLIKNKEVSDNFPKVNSLLSISSAEISKIPKFNYLGLYEAGEAEELLITGAKDDSQYIKDRLFDISYREKDIYILTFCKVRGFIRLYKELHNYIKIIKRT